MRSALFLALLAFSTGCGGNAGVASLWVAVGADGKAAISLDGDTFDGYETGSTNDLYSIAFGNDTFVAVGENGVVILSSDGKIWEQAPSPTSQTIRRVIFDGEKFIAAAQSTFSSPDGKTWAETCTPASSLLDLATSGDRIFAIESCSNTIPDNPNPPSCSFGEFSSSRVIECTKTAFEERTGWHLANNNNGSALNTLAFGGDRWVSAGQDVLYSVDGETWEEGTPAEGQETSSIVYAEGAFWALGGGFEPEDENLFRSEDGISWEMAAAVPGNGSLPFLAYAGKFVAANGGIASSEDGFSWQARTTPGRMHAVCARPPQ